MNIYDQSLQELQQKVALKKQLEAKLSDLRDQRKTFDRKVIELRVAYNAEQEDVQKLEGRSLANYFYNVIGKLDEKLDKERKEAYAARVKLDAAERELSAVDGEIAQIQEQLSALYGIEQTYNAELEKKREQIKASGSQAGLDILSIEEQITQLKAQKREIKEAMSAGRSAMGTADSILSELEDADGWNTWDMLGGGGIITHMAKHSHLDDAQALVEELQGKLRRFKTELADIQISADMQVNIDGFLRFADYFFDGLFADWAVGDRISESQSAVQKTRSQIGSMLTRLENMDVTADKKIASLTARLEELVVNS